ncbi:CinA family protein [Paracoccaceae bacterium]|nr:CinA family protein [Paracoccaceae bacterium]
MRNDILNIAKEIIDLASLHKAVIASAESCTGGLLSSAITDIPGSSTVFECGFVTYSNISKMELLSVKENTLNFYGAVSEEVAGEMAIGAINNSKANLAISITGIAGPGGSNTKPEGMVCFSIAFENETKLTETKKWGALGRNIIRQKATLHGLRLLSRTLKK